ncbi:PAS domain S-box protein [Halorussus gelatinilyticus]|uniref:PAS domain S-box protein n=1 Tax=Halorussus gelatinilyticus TaxID=2937524 RepID=A0A8U0IFF9_9EURY|nr:PAS domain S-box protein [Halorussus gelatinilyticus]UPV99484.1 PAS domain S-box protein [Halorussus gelatinilyticus]
MDAADALADTLAVFDHADLPSTPYTTSEVADELDCSRRTAYNRLERLADRGDIETKKVGARGRVWWRSPEAANSTDGTATDTADSAVDSAADSTDDTDRKGTERELERYETVVETLGDGVYALDSEERFVMANQRFVEMTGYDRDELLGSQSSLVHGESVNETAEELSAAVAGDDREGATLEFELRTKDGETIPVESRFGPYGPDDRYARTGVVRDVADRKRFEETLKSLHDSSRDLLGAESGEAVGEIVVDAATEVLDLPGVIVYRHDADEGRLLPAERSVEAEFMREEFPPVSADDGSITGSAFVGGDPVHHDDVVEASNLRVNPDDTEMRAGSFVPMGDHASSSSGRANPASSTTGRASWSNCSARTRRRPTTGWPARPNWCATASS